MLVTSSCVRRCVLEIAGPLRNKLDGVSFLSLRDVEGWRALAPGAAVSARADGRDTRPHSDLAQVRLAAVFTHTHTHTCADVCMCFRALCHDFIQHHFLLL